MKRIPLSLAMLATLAACDNANPFDEEIIIEGDGTSIEEVLDETTDEIDLDSEAENRGDILRVETLDLETGEGFGEIFELNATDDTLTIDNLAFDGLNVYTRGAEFEGEARVNDIGTIAVYHGDEFVEDFLTDNQVLQLNYVALYDESDVIIEAGEDSDLLDAPRTSFTIVRTGSFSNADGTFGPGGFTYSRAGDVVLAESGQAVFTGDYGAVRAYDSEDVTQIIDGDIFINIDFDDFNDVQGVRGTIENRQAFDLNGRLLPTIQIEEQFSVDLAAEFGTLLDENGVPYGADITLEDIVQLPPIDFVLRISGESIAEDGELSGEVLSFYQDPTSGDLVPYEQGDYFAIIAGDTTGADGGDGGEIVGVVVHESPDPAGEGVIAQETGGFIATR